MESRSSPPRSGLRDKCSRHFDNYLKPESIRMFESIGVMTKKELEARNEVKWEMYTKKYRLKPACSEIWP